MKPVPPSAALLSWVVLLCAATASLTTLLWAGSFPDPSPESPQNRVLAEARGWSAATLLVGIPLTAVSLWAARSGSLRGRLLWLGGLVYFVYTYIEFAVSPPFTALYLLYVLAFACAVPALVIGVASIELAELPSVFGDSPPRRSVGVFSILFSALLAAAWLKDIGVATFAGAFGWPVGEDAVKHVVHALDLGLQVPLGITTGVMLLKRGAAGLLLASIMLVNVVCMGAALTAMVLFSTVDAGTSLWIVTPFAFVWFVGVVLAVRFFRAGLGGAPHDTRAG